jgi:hypothetical protein
MFQNSMLRSSDPLAGCVRAIAPSPEHYVISLYIKSRG